MQVQKNSYVGGILQDLTIEDISEFTREALYFSIKSYDFSEDTQMDPITFFSRVFSKIKIEKINSKNIEAEISFELFSHPHPDVFEKKLNNKGISDVNVNICVYRIGQHSYWLAEVEPIFKIQDN